MERRSDGPRQLAGLDALRALAILLVLTFHYPYSEGPAWFAALAQYGWAGVDLFFVLSGFLIGRQLLAPLARGEALDLRGFYLRRFLRILPSYWVVVAVYLLLPSLREKARMPPGWKFLTFTQNLGLEASAFSHAWSLCVEEHFYLLLPLLVLALGRVRRARWVVAALGAVLVFGLVVRGGLWWHVLRAPGPEAPVWRLYREFIYYPTWGRLDGLLAGVALALLQVFRPSRWERWRARPLVPALVGTLSLIAAGVLSEWSLSLPYCLGLFPLVSLGFAGWVLAATSETASRLCARLPGAHTLAVLSFTVYLTHKMVVHAIHQALGPRGYGPFSGVTVLACAVAVPAVAWCLHRLVERPFLALRERLTMKEAHGWDSVRSG